MTVRYPFSGRFVLRDSLLGSLRERVENGITQIRIVGGVGSGKTSLALQSLYQPFVHGRFPRGPVYISLAEPNFAAAIALKAMDARLRKTRVSNYVQTSYSKGEEGYSAPGAGDNRGPTIRFGLAQINLEAPRDGCIVILDDVSPLKALNGGDSTRDLMTVFLNNIFPPDKNLYISLMRPWDSERIPFVEYGRVQDAVFMGDYSEGEVGIGWKWSNESVCQALYYNPLALTFYRSLEDQGQITEDTLFSITPDDVAPWINSIFLPWATSCSDDYWSPDFWMSLVTLLSLPDCGTEEECIKVGLEKWDQLVQKYSAQTILRESTSTAIRNDMVDLDMAGLIRRVMAVNGNGVEVKVSPLAKSFAAFWLRSRYARFYGYVSGEVDRAVKSRSFRLFSGRN